MTRQRRRKTDPDALKKKYMQHSEKKSYQDDRFWSYDNTVDDAYVIRFIPDPTEDEIFVELKYHIFNYKQPNGETKLWYRLCPRHFGKDCPICAKASKLWDYHKKYSDTDIERIAKSMFAKTQFVSNIYILEDRQEPKNEGQVKLFRYGNQIKEKIDAQVNPPDNKKNSRAYREYFPFDLDHAANFEFSVKGKTKTNRYPSYSDSKFIETEIGPIADTEDEIVEILNKAYNLEEYMQGLKVPTNEEILDKLGYYLNQLMINIGESVVEEIPHQRIAKPKSHVEPEPEETQSEESYEEVNTEDDDEMFDNL